MSTDPSHHLTEPRLVLHSSIGRIVLASLTPVVLLGIGVPGLLQRVWVVTIVLSALGVGTALTVLLDLPLRAEFDSEGVTRVCMLRRQRLPWSSIVALERTPARPRRRRGFLSGTGARDAAEPAPEDSPPGPRASQGLVARTGPRRLTLLVDRRESAQEFDELKQLLRERATVLRAGAPPLDAAPAGRGPTALHRRVV